MATLETGFFILLNILAFGFMIYALKIDLALAPFIRLFSILLFFVTGLYLLSGYEISNTVEAEGFEITRNSTGGVLFNVTSPATKQTLIAENGNGFWFGWIYAAFGFLNMFLMYLDFFRGG